MLDDRVSDLPVVDAAGRFIGMFKLDRLYATLLPKAALIGYGMPDLAFVSDTLGQLREKMREIEHLAVRDFVVKPHDVVHPGHARRSKSSCCSTRAPTTSRWSSATAAGSWAWCRRAIC